MLWRLINALAAKLSKGSKRSSISSWEYRRRNSKTLWRLTNALAALSSRRSRSVPESPHGVTLSKHLNAVETYKRICSFKLSKRSKCSSISSSEYHRRNSLMLLRLKNALAAVSCRRGRSTPVFSHWSTEHDIVINCCCQLHAAESGSAAVLPRLQFLLMRVTSSKQLNAVAAAEGFVKCPMEYLYSTSPSSTMLRGL